MADISTPSNQDSQMSALDGISLDTVMNPNTASSSNPSTMGNPPKPVDNPAANPAPVTEPPANDPPAPTPGEEDDKGDNADVDVPSNIKSFEDLVSIVGTKDFDKLSENEKNDLTDIVDTFGGEAFNKDGAIVDDKGAVLYTADQVKHYLTEGELPVDDNGNFVDATGAVVKSKVELFRENTTVGTVMNALSKNFNVSFREDWTPEDNEDSLVDVVNKVVKFAESRSVEGYMNANPELEAFRKHLLLHGSADGYKSSSVDYDSVVVKDLSKDAKQLYIAEAYKASGRTLTPTFSKYLESLGEEDLNIEVAANLAVLKGEQVKRQQTVDAQLKQQELDSAKEIEQYYTAVTNTIKSGKLSNINIPIPEREAFLAYVTTPTQNGMSKDMIDAEKDDVNFDLLMSYLRFKGKDIGALARNISATQQADTLRAKMAKNKPRNNNSGKGTKPTTPSNYIPSLGEVKF